MKPILQALLIADKIYTDRSTGKHVIAGIFQTLGFIRPENIRNEPIESGANAPFSIPGMSAGSPFAYASLTGIRGEQPLILRYVDLDDERVIFQYDIKVRSDDPLKTAELAIPLPVLPSDKAGQFALEMLWNNEPLGMFRVSVKEFNSGEGEDD